MISIATGFLGTAWSLINANWITRGIAGLVVVLGAWKVNNIIVGKKAVSKHVERSIADGKKRNNKARQIREDIYSGKGSVGSLPCRDC